MFRLASASTAVATLRRANGGAVVSLISAPLSAVTLASASASTFAATLTAAAPSTRLLSCRSPLVTTLSRTSDAVSLVPRRLYSDVGGGGGEGHVSTGGGGAEAGGAGGGEGGGSRYNGRCKWFDPKKGFGFIVPNDGSEDIFVHHSSINLGGFRSLMDGEDVEYELYVEPSGRRRAENVTGPDGARVKGAPRRYQGTDFGYGGGGGRGAGGGEGNYFGGGTYGGGRGIGGPYEGGP